MVASKKARFKKVRQLGLGTDGVGPIFEARDDALDRSVAIRELAQPVVDDPRLADRAIAQMKKMAAISHPNVMTIHAVEPHHQPPRFILELLTGKTLANLMTEGPVPPERVAVLLGQGLEGLQQLHHHGVIHGDLRPDRLFLQRDVLKIGAFGLTALRSRPQSVASVRYSSPEGLEKDAVLEPTADLFSLGLIAYELCLGTERFLRVVVESLERMEVEVSSADTSRLWHKLRSSSTELPPLREVDPSVPMQISNVISHLMRQNPAERPKTCRQALRELASMRGWTAIFEAVRPPVSRTNKSPDPVEDLFRRLSPQRAILTIVTVMAIALVVVFIRVRNDIGNGADSAQGPPSALSGQPSLGSPRELLTELGSLVASNPTTGIRVSGGSQTLEIGDTLSFEVTTEEPAYAVVFVVSFDGSILCLYPNRKSQHLRLEANQTVLPRTEDNLQGLALKVDLPVGKDDVFLLTSQDPLTYPPTAQGVAGDWLLAYPFVPEAENPAAKFLVWINRVAKRDDAELVQYSYRTVESLTDPQPPEPNA